MVRTQRVRAWWQKIAVDDIHTNAQRSPLIIQRYVYPSFFTSSVVLVYWKGMNILNTQNLKTLLLWGSRHTGDLIHRTDAQMPRFRFIRLTLSPSRASRPERYKSPERTRKTGRVLINKNPGDDPKLKPRGCEKNNKRHVGINGCRISRGVRIWFFLIFWRCGKQDIEGMMWWQISHIRRGSFHKRQVPTGGSPPSAKITFWEMSRSVQFFH
jgi:hypothetical protein